jgi:hypothetical protein
MRGAKAAVYLGYARLEQQSRTMAKKSERGISSAGRAPALQAGGRRFDPVILHQHLSIQHQSGFETGCFVVDLALTRQLGCSLTIHRVESALLAEMCFMALPCR